MDEPSAGDGVPVAVSRLAADILRICSEERFSPGERIGSERDLAERLGVGRSTLRLAIELLEQQGAVRRVLGRTGGLFFDDGRIQRHLNTVEGVPDMVLRQGRTLVTRVIRTEVGHPHADETRALRLRQPDAVVRVERLRLVDGISWSLDHSALPSIRFPALTAHDLSGSLYGLLRNQYSLVLDRSDESVEVVTATPAQAALLNIPVASALLAIRRIAWDSAGDPIEYAHDFFRADRTRMHLQKYGTNWKRTVRLSSTHPG